METRKESIVCFRDDDGDTLEGLLATEKRTDVLRNRDSGSRVVLYFFLTINVMWTIILITQNVVRHSTLNWDLRRGSKPSPLFEAIDLSPKWRTMNGTIHSHGSIYRQPPSDKVDAAWLAVTFDGSNVFNITEADIVAAGKDPSTATRWDPAVDSYPGQAEFSHKIHCINELRKEIWGEHYFGEYAISVDDAAIARGDYDPNTDNDLWIGEPRNLTWKGKRRQHRQHTMHCLHMILQDQMCNVDVGIVTHHWVEDVPGEPPHALADFSTVKKCRDFEAAGNWLRKHAVPNERDAHAKLIAPEGVKVMKTDDSYWPERVEPYQ